MRITDIRSLLHHPARLTLIEVHTDAGIVGLGSTGSPPGMIESIIDDPGDGLRQLVVGEDPGDPEALWRRMAERWPAQRGRADRGGLQANAMGAIDMAVWDIAGKAAGKPVHELLGGARRDRVLAYGSASTMFYAASKKSDETARERELRHKPPEEIARECTTLREQGFRAVKFGWGNDFGDEGMAKLAAAREALGPDVRLSVDFGCPAYFDPSWSVEQAIEAAHKLEAYDVYFFEEALHPLDVDGFAEVTAATSVHIATGESLTTTEEFEPFIRQRALDIVQPDAAQMGITQTFQVARDAEAAGMMCVPHGPWTVFTVTCHTQILSVAGLEPMIEYPALVSYRGEGLVTQRATALANYELVETPPELVDGHVVLPQGPGLGLGNFVPEAVERYQALMEEAASMS
ncbi:MAG: mandelate racemase/muconate lactonizing enzyme family protein [Chloroflexi bacterium]|nr:mandelate racemase/muconate lactonizing enzyme family protein [Chloroflexota bacterium]